MRGITVTRITWHIKAPRERVYPALVEAPA